MFQSLIFKKKFVNMLDIVFEIALNIIVIMGALSMIFVFVILLYILMILKKINYFVSDIVESYDIAKWFLSAPFKYIISKLKDK